MKIYKSLFMGMLFAYQIPSICLSPEAEAELALWNQIQELIAGQPISKDILDNLVAVKENNTFDSGELVAIKRSSGDFTYGFIIENPLYARNPNPSEYIVYVGKGLKKTVHRTLIKEVLGKFKRSPNLGKFLIG